MMYCIHILFLKFDNLIKLYYNIINYQTPITLIVLRLFYSVWKTALCQRGVCCIKIFNSKDVSMDLAHNPNKVGYKTSNSPIGCGW